MRHIDLFSGIGGFALAAKWTWGEDYQNIGHSEIEKFPCKVYHHHFPESECLGDITKIEWEKVITNARCVRSTKHEIQTAGIEQCNSIDLLTGGFPCQPFSVAGKQRGKEDDRALWHEMLRAIREVRPRWVIGENVAGIIPMELDNVLSDLEAEKYQTEVFVIPACAVNAPHRRDRVWIVAHSESDRGRRISGEIREKDGGSERGLHKRTVDADKDAPHSRRQHGEREADEGEPQETSRQQPAVKPERPAGCNTGGTLTHSEKPRGERGKSGKSAQRQEGILGWNDSGKYTQQWEEHWYNVALRTCVRTLDDGLPEGLARPKGWRVNALKSLGNAIVPAVAHEIMKAIKQSDES